MTTKKQKESAAHLRLQRIIQTSMAGLRVALEQAFIAGLDRAEEIQRQVIREQIAKGGRS